MAIAQGTPFLTQLQGDLGALPDKTNALTSNLSQTFVSVGGNVEVVVSANAAGTFNLDVGNVPGSARGGAVTLTAGGSQEFSFTAALRDGTSNFQLSLSDSTDPAAESSTAPADAVVTTNQGGSGGASLAASFSQQAGLALAIALIGSPTGELDAAVASGSAGGGPGSAAAAGGAPGGAGQSLSQNSGQRWSSAGDRGGETQAAHFLENLLNTIDQALRDEGEKLGKRLPLVKSTLRILERATVVGEALGWRGRAAPRPGATRRRRIEGAGTGPPRRAGVPPPLKRSLHDLLLLTAQLESQQAAGPGAARETLALLDRAVLLGPPSRKDFRLRALADRQRGDDRKAAEEQRRAEDSGVQSTSLDHFLLGEDLNRAIQLNPEFLPARLNRGVVYWHQGKLDPALADFAAVLTPPKEKRLIEAAFSRGQLYL
ncbi:MAG: hypothetical protein ACHRXM_38265 [Isosphaerales bacterium]